jgi:hypothetical protein
VARGHDEVCIVPSVGHKIDWFPVYSDRERGQSTEPTPVGCDWSPYDSRSRLHANQSAWDVSVSITVASGDSGNDESTAKLRTADPS